MIFGIWNDRLIREECERGLVDSFDPALINPASLDLRLGNEFINVKTGNKFVADRIVIVPGQAMLATTFERVRLPNYVAAQLSLKSTMARDGLDHNLAGWVDPGFDGELTLELHSHKEVVLHAQQRIAQLVFMGMAEVPEQSYNGKYQYQVGPTQALKEKR